MQAISNNLSSDQFETLNQKLSEIQNLISGKDLKIEQKPKKDEKLGYFPAVKDYKFLTENKKQFLFKNIDIDAYNNTQFEIFSGMFPAFKPFELQMQVRDENNEELDCELLGIYIMGGPQLINFNGTTVDFFRGTTKVFRKSKQVNFDTFGCSAGQGLQINIKNPYDKKLQITTLLIGSDDIVDHVGKGGTCKNSSYLFGKYEIKANETKKVCMLSCKIESIKPKKLQIIVLDEQGKSTNINILDITHRKTTKFANYSPYKLSTSFFEESKEINLGEFGATENQALVFEFENPTNKNVRAFINLEN